jgi:dUTP pyrophosphatase
MELKNVKIEFADPTMATILFPIRAKSGDVGYDLKAAEDCVVGYREIILIPCGFKIEIEEGYEAQVRSRSGLAKQGISVVNSPGTVDPGFRGILSVLLINNSPSWRPFEIKIGDRIAQMVFNKVELPDFTIVEHVAESERGENGFGSTGTK